MTLSVIYVLQSGDAGPVKVGRTTEDRVEKRIRELQTGNPERIHLRYVFPGGSRLEALLHRKLENHHLSGEWFAPFAMTIVRGFFAVHEPCEREGNFPFPGIRAAYPLDENHSYIILTEAMTEMQMRRLIGIRRKQVADDQAYLAVLEHAYQAVRPIWGAHPDWTFGQVCAVFQEAVA